MPSPGSGYGLFFREFLRNFHTTGAVMPSGPRLCKALARYVGQGDGAKQVLEVGPGTGVVTRRIVHRLGADDRLDLVEINPGFVKRLLYDLEHDPLLKPAARRIAVHQIPIEELGRERRYDVIVSGLPLNNFPAELVKNIRRGDTVVTSGGLVGKVTKVVDDDQIEFEISDGVRVRQMRQMISGVRAKGEPAKEKAEPVKDETSAS